MTDPVEPTAPRFDIGVLGAGSATETLVEQLAGSGRSVVVFEPGLVGGECPFLACMPSKAMLHDAGARTAWSDAVARRDRITEHRDDAGHAAALRDRGAHLVRSRGRFAGPGCLHGDDGTEVTVRHVVIATGSAPIVPPLDGDAPLWTSDDALVADERPASLAIVGSGVIGCELAQLFAGFGTQVTVVGLDDTLFPDLVPEIGEHVARSLADAGVTLRLGRTATAAHRQGDETRLVLDDGSTILASRVLVAVGQRPVLDGLGLETIGLAPDRPLPVGQDGRVEAPGSVWAIGDVAGFGQYTHLANHHARVVAANLTGGQRRFDEAVLPRCVFVDPPVVMVGPTPAELRDDPPAEWPSGDVVWRSSPLDVVARAITDDSAPGHLAVAARRSTRTIVAAHGVGPRFDELVHALTIAIDGQVPLEVLARSIQPFPTLGEVLGVVFRDLLDAVGGHSSRP